VFPAIFRLVGLGPCLTGGVRPSYYYLPSIVPTYEFSVYSLLLLGWWGAGLR
jgi:hypothetical protein